MKCNSKKKCNGKMVFSRKSDVLKVYICNRCGSEHFVYRKKKGGI